MSPAFPSWAAFFAMGGYAFYVWLAAAATVLSMIGLVVHTLWQRRALLADIRRRQAQRLRIRRGSAPAGSGVAPVPPRENIQ